MPEESNTLIAVEIRGLMLEPESNSPILILSDPATGALLPIWIGVFEASAIQMKLEGMSPERPMTHDLLLASLQQLGSSIERVVVSDLQDSTFYATVVLQRDGQLLELDSRPSDAIALAVRAECPLFVAKTVMDSAKVLPEIEGQTDAERLKQWFDELDPDDLGKYTM